MVRRTVLSSPVAGLVLDLAYLSFLVLCLPILLYRVFTTNKYRQGLPQRLLGRVPERQGSAPCLWIQAVSLGEMRATRRLVEHLREELPGWQLAISASTRTGYEAACKQYPDDHVFYTPLDLGPTVRRVFDRIRPTAMLYFELDLWPNALREAHARGVPVMLANGRMSPKSFRGYRRLRTWVGPMLGALELVLVQDDSYAERYAALGCDPARIEVSGNVKYDLLPAPDDAATAAVRAVTGHTAETILLGGSTSGEEERAVLDAFDAHRAAHPGLRLVLCPRHPERGDEIAREITRRGHRLARRSAGAAPDPDAVWLFDTIGELTGLYRLGDLVFVGGSLFPRGGQNMLEPAALGKPVMVGPNTWNFRRSVEWLRAHDALIEVADPAALTAAVGRLLSDPDGAAAMGERARLAVLPHRGASEMSARRIGQTLDRLVEGGVLRRST